MAVHRLHTQKSLFDFPFKGHLPRAGTILGSLSNYDDDHNGQLQKTNRLMIKTTALHVHHALWHISLTSTADYDVKPPNLTFYGGGGHTTTKFPSPF